MILLIDNACMCACVSDEDPLLTLGRAGPRGSGPPYICDRCGTPYAHRSSLLRHAKHECGKEPQFRCPYCNRRTTQSGSLKGHIRMIHPGQPLPSEAPRHRRPQAH